MGNQFFSEDGGYLLLIVSFLAAGLSLLGGFKKGEPRYKRLLGVIGITLASLSLLLSWVVKSHDDEKKTALEQNLANTLAQSHKISDSVQVLMQNLHQTSDSLTTLRDKQLALKVVLISHLHTLRHLTSDSVKALERQIQGAVALDDTIIREDGILKTRITKVDTGLAGISGSLATTTEKIKAYAEDNKVYFDGALSTIQKELAEKYSGLNKELANYRYHTDSLIDYSYAQNEKELHKEITMLERLQRVDSLTTDSLLTVIHNLKQKSVAVLQVDSGPNRQDTATQAPIRN